MDEMYSATKKETNLKRLRREVRLTQKELAEQSGVPLRTLQQYEQGQKNINKAAAEQVHALSKILVCNVKDLLE
ncbi:MAG: helix-turn-helix domain-containing protein [Eubacterium sp.]|nr:helix-turn-helix domain-containing protein [Eubacterium sp.]